MSPTSAQIQHDLLEHMGENRAERSRSEKIDQIALHMKEILRYVLNKRSW